MVILSILCVVFCETQSEWFSCGFCLVWKWVVLSWLVGVWKIKTQLWLLWEKFTLTVSFPAKKKKRGPAVRQEVIYCGKRCYWVPVAIILFVQQCFFLTPLVTYRSWPKRFFSMYVTSLYRKLPKDCLSLFWIMEKLF